VINNSLNVYIISLYTNIRVYDFFSVIFVTYVISSSYSAEDVDVGLLGCKALWTSIGVDGMFLRGNGICLQVDRRYNPNISTSRTYFLRIWRYDYICSLENIQNRNMMFRAVFWVILP
jgi:hypothetical protein